MANIPENTKWHSTGDFYHGMPFSNNLARKLWRALCNVYKKITSVHSLTKGALTSKKYFTAICNKLNQNRKLSLIEKKTGLYLNTIKLEISHTLHVLLKQEPFLTVLHTIIRGSSFSDSEKIVISLKHTFLI